jgi:hypothetical protein
MIKVLEYLSEILERRSRRQAGRARADVPVCVISTLGLAVFFLVGFVIPKFASMYAQKKLGAAHLHQDHVAFGDSVQNFWWLYMLRRVGAVDLRRPRRPGGAPTGAWHREAPAQDPVPPTRSSSGMSVARSPASSASALHFRPVPDRRPADGRQVLGPAHAHDGRRDDGLPGPQRRAPLHVLLVCHYLPGFAKRHAHSGEESAELTRMCSVIARHFERDTTRLTKNLSTVIEPVLIVLIAAVVLVVALAIFLPMWNMVKLLS